jgi:hypothetical protein
VSLLGWFKKQRVGIKAAIITVLGGGIFALVVAIIPLLDNRDKTIIIKFAPTDTPLVTPITRQLIPTPSSTITNTPAPTSTLINAPTFTFTPIPTTTPTASRPVTVGIVGIDKYIYTDILDRLRSIGLHPEWISPSADYSTFVNYDVIYLPMGWGYAAQAFNDMASQYRRYIEDGYGLVLEQPNFNDRFEPSFIPSVVFELGSYDPSDWPPSITKSNDITEGLDRIELPGAANRIIDYDANVYDVLVEVPFHRYATLLVANYGQGRIAISATGASTSKDVRHPVSDEFLTRLFLWAAGRLP